MKRVFILGISLILTSCGLDENRIDLIKEKSGLELPPIYEIVRNESVDAGSIDGDFFVYIDLQFDKDNFKMVQENIRRHTHLGNWTNFEFGKKFDGNDPNEPTLIEVDTIKMTLKFEMHHI